MAGSEERLKAYRRKRDFARTPEPAGGSEHEPRPGEDRLFVVQRHRARRLHYDFRLEIDGVLVSWAVPKGPTLDADVRRAAFHVEDHPLEYFDFEGVIPAGEYGGGDVIVWDVGTWVPDQSRRYADPAKAVRAGELHLDMFGEKLRGRFVLVRTSDPNPSREDWLLLHKHDDVAVAGWNAEDHPHSVLSGRTNDEVLADPHHIWRSDMPAAVASIPLKPSPTRAVSAAELTELDSLGSAGTWHIFDRALKVTNLDKVLFPGRGKEPPVDKRELLRYTARIVPTVLPYVAGRAMNLHRYPDGATARGFWSKELPKQAPKWLARWTNPEADEGQSKTYLVVNEAAALVWAANFGGLEWHAWTSQVDRPQLPTYAMVDLDQGAKTSWDDLLVLARLHRSAFEHMGVVAQPKLTGRRGIQIWVPISRGPTFDDTREWVEKLSKSVGAVVPELVSWKWQVGDRGGLARLDYTQNAINKTLVAPYSPRPALGAPVSAPIAWSELDDPLLRPDRWTVRTIHDRVADVGDLFASVLGPTQSLPPLR